MEQNNIRQALYIKGDGKEPSKLLKKEVENSIEVLVDKMRGLSLCSFAKEYSRSKLTIPCPKKLLAISDLEGEFDVMVQLLKANGVIDNSLNWTYDSSFGLNWRHG